MEGVFKVGDCGTFFNDKAEQTYYKLGLIQDTSVLYNYAYYFRA